MNLLMVIDLACDGLLQELPEASPLREDVQQIAEAKARLLAILESMRPEADRPGASKD